MSIDPESPDFKEKKVAALRILPDSAFPVPSCPGPVFHIHTHKRAKEPRSWMPAWGVLSGCPENLQIMPFPAVMEINRPLVPDGLWFHLGLQQHLFLVSLHHTHGSFGHTPALSLRLFNNSSSLVLCIHPVGDAASSLSTWNKQQQRGQEHLV